MLDDLRALKAACGGILTATDVRRHGAGTKGKPGAVPSYRTVYLRFGSWRRICELLGQPYAPHNQYNMLLAPRHSGEQGTHER